MDPAALATLKSNSEKIAIEFVFAEPGKDLGLLPVNGLLGDLEALVATQTVPDEIVQSIAVARRWLDEVFASTGLFNAPVLKRFGEWTVWWKSAIAACENHTPIPPIPAEWSSPQPDKISLAVGTSDHPLDSPTKCDDGQLSRRDDASHGNGYVSPTSPCHEDSGVAVPVLEQEPILQLNLPEDHELLNEFIQESQEHLQNIEQGVLVLEDNPTDAETLDNIFRAFHTFKGGSGFLNLTPIQSLAHELESLLDLARQNKLVLTPPVISLILEGGDTLKLFVAEIATRLAANALPERGQPVRISASAPPIVVPILQLLQRIRVCLAGETSAQEDSPPSSLSPRPRAESASSAETDATHSNSLAAPPVLTHPQESEAPRSLSRAGLPVATAVKVDTAKLDSLVDLVGEMVIAQSLVVQNPELCSLQSEQLARDLSHLGRITRDLQRTAMSLRMVPIGPTFQKMNRLVRDLAAKLAKQVELVTEGDDTELDRTIVEEISDPLIHMVRNSVDHGIEMPEFRQQKGKPAQGTICLNAFHQGGNIVIEIKDDGKGLDRDKILAKAIEKGFAKPGETLSNSQIFKMILQPGFSTADKITDVSGRGVGMDVVQRNIEKLRGKLEIQSVPGQGTTLSIHLPLTLAIIDGLVVGVASHRFIVPTLLVRESFRPAAGMISTVQGRGEVINVRGRLCPLLRLSAVLGIPPIASAPIVVANPTIAPVPPTAAAVPITSGISQYIQGIVLVLEVGDTLRCILVDKLLGKQEVVIKGLGETFRQNSYFAGAAILGDGGVGLILDPQSLVNLNSTPLANAA